MAQLPDVFPVMLTVPDLSCAVPVKEKAEAHCALIVKVAVTLLAELIVTTQDAVPEHPPPLQPVNVEPSVVAAISVTDVGVT